MTNLIGNKYQLGEKLGRGGMGTVYSGIDTQTNTSVAIKRLHPDMTSDEQIARFQREGAALRELNHPNIVKMLDAFQDDDHYYLVMEYIRGGDLKHMIQSDALSTEQIIGMGIDLADALTRAHKLGIIHRDLKPANVLIAEDGTLRLTDFGIAHVRHQATLGDADTILGTVEYLSPEAISAEIASEQMDIWALGIMLYEMLVGTTPFSRENLSLTIVAIKYDPIPTLSDIVSDVPTALEDLIYRMLERDPHARISSVRYVGAILEDIQQGRTTSTSYGTRFESTNNFQEIIKHNLPEPITEFVGRETEIQEIHRLLQTDSQRLITILAQGGMGKTRLALEIARQSLGKYEDGVYFVELVSLDDDSKIVSQIATALNVSLSGGDSKQQLLKELSDKKLLLILDNWEHLPHGSSIVTDILQAAPDVKIIATSRLRLGEMGETVFQLTGMKFPKWETPADALEYAAVKLFMNSAVRARPSFELLTEDLDYIARICRLVQGMPLGILLSAAWVAMLSPKDIADELEQGFDLLVDEVGELPERQQSIRVVMDYAWQSMTDTEQSVFAKLAIFRGGFTREAAQKISNANLRTLMSLVNKSMIRRDNDSGRYEIHELLRQFAEEHLEQLSDYEATREAHLAYFSTFVIERHQPLQGSTRQPVIGAELRQEMENTHRAWFYATEKTDIKRMRPMLECLHTYYFDFAFNHFDAANLYEHTLDKFPTVDDSEITHFKQMLKIHFAEALIQTGNPQRAQQIVADGIAYADAHPDDIYMTHFALRTQGRLYGIFGDIEAAYQMLQERALPTAQKMPDQTYYLDTLKGKAYLLSMLGVFYQDEMVQTLQEALKIAEEVDDNKTYSLMMNNMSAVKVAMGNWDEAERMIRSMLATVNKFHSPVTYAIQLYSLARMHYVKGEFDQAMQLAQKVLQVALEIDNYQVVSRTHFIFGMVARASGDYDKAITYLQQALRYAQTASSYHDVKQNKFYLALNQYTLSPSDENRETLLSTIAQALNDYQLLVRIDAVLGLASIKYQEEDYQQATQLLANVLEHPKCPPLYETFEPLVELRENLLLALSETDYQAAYTHGKNQEFETIEQTLRKQYSS